MKSQLLQEVERFSARYANVEGIAALPIGNINIVRSLQPSMIGFAVNRPLVALLLQGEKSVSAGSETHHFKAGESLIVTAEMPTISQVTKASPATPYYSFIAELDLPLLRELALETDAIGSPAKAVQIEQTDQDVAATALRIMQLLDRGEAVKFLGGGLIRELHFWLLNGRHRETIRAIAAPESQFRRISNVMDIIRASYTQPLAIGELAQHAGMSLSSFHQHFRAVTKLSPLQYQKQLRLIEARRRLLQNGEKISTVAYDVGYESVPQFTREYSRFFGCPPARDVRDSNSLRIAS